MKKRLRIIIPLLVLIIIGVVVFNVFRHRKNGTSLQFSGNIEVTETQMSFQDWWSPAGAAGGRR